MKLKEHYIKQLQKHPYKTIALIQLEQWCPVSLSYTDFSSMIRLLMQEEILVAIKTSGENGKRPSLPYKYRIQLYRMQAEIQQQIKTQAKDFHPAMNLSRYYRQHEKVWKRDLPILHKINEYLHQYGEVFTGHSLPELSWKLTGNEKWLEGEGRKILEGIGLWKQVEKQIQPDPLMMAVNFGIVLESTKNHAGRMLHLVVENKSIYYRLLPYLASSGMTTLIYGAGRKIVAGLSQLPRQLGVESSDDIHHKIQYFGDLDWEGIAIWHDLHKRYVHQPNWQLTPAIPFYQSLAQCSWSQGKTNQRQQEKALKAFLTHFSSEEGERFRWQLESGFYCPQEALEEGLETLIKKG